MQPSAPTISSAVLATPRAPRRRPAHSAFYRHRGSLGEPENSRVGWGTGRGVVAVKIRTPPATPGRTCRVRSQRARRRAGPRGRGFPDAPAGQRASHQNSRASAAAGSAGRGARVRVSGCVWRGRGESDIHDQHWVEGLLGSDTCLGAGPGPPRPQGTAAPRATARGGEGSARHAVHFLFEARRRPPPRAARQRPGQARPFA